MPFSKNILLDRPSCLEFPEISTIYNRFAALQGFSFNPEGVLLLHAGLDPDGVALSMAANVSGAASLCIEPEVFLAKQAIRCGVCDFLANDLDEALRILKNEVRKAKPVAVAVSGEPEYVVAEAVERGLQPEIVHVQSEGVNVAGVETLLTRGARPLWIDHRPQGLIPVHWSVAREPLRWLPLADRQAADSLDPLNPMAPARRRWIECSPRFLGRTFAAQRFLWMTPAEADRFFLAVQREVEAGEIQVAVSVVRNGEEELVLS